MVSTHRRLCQTSLDCVNQFLSGFCRFLLDFAREGSFCYPRGGQKWSIGKKKLKNQNKKIFAIGPFATNMFNLYTNAGATVIMGEPEFFFLENPNLDKSFEKEQVIFNNNLKLDDLPFPKWDLMIKNLKNKNKS